MLLKEQTAEMFFQQYSFSHFATSSQCMWHFVTEHRSEIVKPRMLSHFSESSDPSYVSSAMCPECPPKEWRTKSFWLQPKPTGKQPKVCPRTKWRNYISDLSWSRLGVEPAEPFEISVDRVVFRVHVGLLPPRPGPVLGIAGPPLYT